MRCKTLHDLAKKSRQIDKSVFMEGHESFSDVPES